jgi:hypothetical protein
MQFRHGKSVGLGDPESADCGRFELEYQISSQKNHFKQANNAPNRQKMGNTTMKGYLKL